MKVNFCSCRLSLERAILYHLSHEISENLLARPFGRNRHCPRRAGIPCRFFLRRRPDPRENRRRIPLFPRFDDDLRVRAFPLYGQNRLRHGQFARISFASPIGVFGQFRRRPDHRIPLLCDPRDPRRGDWRGRPWHRV